MPVTIELNGAELDDYREFLESKLTAIELKLKPLLDEKMVLVNKISKITGSVSEHDHRYPKGYFPTGSINSRIVAILEDAGEPLYTRDIINKILELQPELKLTKELEEKTSKNVSTVLSIGTSMLNPLYIRHKDQAGNFLYKLNN